MREGSALALRECSLLKRVLHVTAQTDHPTELGDLAYHPDGAEEGQFGEQENNEASVDAPSGLRSILQ